MSIPGAVQISSTDPATRFARVSYRIASEEAGSSSAVISHGADKNLTVNPEGLQDTNGKWSANYIVGFYEIYSSSGQYVTIGPNDYVIGGSDNTLWALLDSTDPSRCYIQDSDSKKVWQYEENPDGAMIKLVRKVEGESRQLWAFVKNDA